MATRHSMRCHDILVIQIVRYESIFCVAVSAPTASSVAKETVVIAKCTARGLALSALLLAASSPAFAQADHAGMPGMAGMNHGPKIEVPPGSGITVADVEFMQGMIAHHA